MLVSAVMPSKFVKARFGSVRKAMAGASHGDVMKALSAQWKVAKCHSASSGAAATAIVDGGEVNSDDDNDDGNEDELVDGLQQQLHFSDDE